MGPLGDALLGRFESERLLELDQEGRCVMTHHGGGLLLVNVYVPAGSLEPVRAQFKQDFMLALRLRCLPSPPAERDREGVEPPGRMRVPHATPTPVLGTQPCWLKPNAQREDSAPLTA